MLYLSRFLGPDAYGVVDTDDGVEDIVSFSDLYSALIAGIEVVGVCATNLSGHTIHQPAETSSQFQVKTNLLYGVDVKTFGDTITNIRLDNCSKPVTLRLSYYGKSCAGFIFTGNKNVGRHRLTLVVDVDFTEDTFKVHPMLEFFYAGASGIGVIYDLRELDDEKAGLAYKTIFVDSAKELSASVIDVESRKRRMISSRFGRRR